MQERESGRSVSLRSRLACALCLAPVGRLDVEGIRYPGRRGVPLALGYDMSALESVPKLQLVILQTVTLFLHYATHAVFVQANFQNSLF